MPKFNAVKYNRTTYNNGNTPIFKKVGIWLFQAANNILGNQETKS